MQITISVCVITYNHEKYIKKCLDSILAQELAHRFELIIRDDCSQDGTSGIIAEYAAKHPDTIKMLPGDKNLGANANLLTIFAASQGEFIALCEGDDFWTDNGKLRKQLERARLSLDVDLFTHPASTGSDEDTVARRWPCQASEYFGLQDILSGFGQFAPTASYFFRRTALAALPSWFAKAPIGDFFIELYLTGRKKGYSLADNMSKYRTASTGSWDDQIKNDRSGEKGVKAYRLIKIYLKKARTDFPEYDRYFQKRLEYVNFAIAHQYMKIGNYPKFLLYINKAGNGVATISRAAEILFRFRNVKPVVSVLYNIKKLNLYAKTVFQSRH